MVAPAALHKPSEEIKKSMKDQVIPSNLYVKSKTEKAPFSGISNSGFVEAEVGMESKLMGFEIKIHSCGCSIRV